ncbi:MAG: L-2-hydroxyglutarate oxidase [Saprospiraceae bacterium]|nr:L-2-hydroxyglutarate oxidase [Saprospiraceae bacterium]
MASKKVTIIGAGIVGLATAYQLLELHPDLQLTILEKESEICKHQTGNNSGVIHSGIYYKPGSLRAQNCIRGYKMLLDFCRTYNIRHEICGKIIVATEESELLPLNNIYERGLANQLQGIKLVSKNELQEIEPHVAGIKGIFVPQAGIIDYTEVGKKYLEIIESKGGRIIKNQRVKFIHRDKNALQIQTENNSYSTDTIINCAGLYSDKIARLTQEDIPLQILPFRGEYYKVKEEKKHLVKNLIYPTPDPNFPFLGVHFTRMIDGALEAGPNAVLALKREGYKKSDVNIFELIETLSYPGFRKLARKFWRQGFEEYKRSFSKHLFTKSLQKLIPEIQEEDLVPGGSGVRASACNPEGSIIDDFVIFETGNIINVCNAPSPAATASLSIVLTIAERIK